MRKTARISPTRMPLLTSSSSRRYFPAWIDSDDNAAGVDFGGSVVLPRLRAALPLRRVFSLKALAARRQSDARVR